MIEGSTDHAIEIEKIGLEREKVRRKYWQTLIVSGAAVVVTALISAAVTIYTAHQQREKETELQEMRLSYDKEIEVLKSDNEKELQILKAKNEQEIHLIKAKNNKELQAEQIDNSRALELLKVQSELLLSLKDQVMSSEITERIRVAHLFSLLSFDTESRGRWSKYHTELVESYKLILAKEKAGDKTLFNDRIIPPALLRSGCEANPALKCP